MWVRSFYTTCPIGEDPPLSRSLQIYYIILFFLLSQIYLNIIHLKSNFENGKDTTGMKMMIGMKMVPLTASSIVSKKKKKVFKAIFWLKKVIF